MKKKMLSIVLAGAMTAAMLTGCGSSASTETNDAATKDTAAEDTAAEDSAEASDQTAGSEGGTFKIGGIGPLTGGAAVYGIAAMNGSQIAVDEINAAGGINGMTVELNFQDDELDAEKSVNAYNALKDWGAQVLDGCVTDRKSVV